MLVNCVKFSYEYFLIYISLPFFCVVCLSFAMITYSVGADVAAMSEAPLKVDESSFKLIEGFSGSYCK